LIRLGFCLNGNGPCSRLSYYQEDSILIGIGAGPGCDGQVQVINDILGSTGGYVPKHAQQYANLNEIIKNAVTLYQNEVKHGEFPTEKESFSLDESVLADLK
jgi:3-methyl-2-oxobutanoate hydroxymethyltransferase